MKKILLVIFSIIIANSFSSIALAVNHGGAGESKIAKILVLNDDAPAPIPPPTPAPEPAPPPVPPTPEPKPY